MIGQQMVEVIFLGHGPTMGPGNYVTGRKPETSCRFGQEPPEAKELEFIAFNCTKRHKPNVKHLAFAKGTGLRPRKN